MRMTIDRRRFAMRGPARMRDAHTIEKLPLHIWLFLLINKALKLSDLADLLVQHDFAFVIAVDGHTCRVIASVLEAR